MPDVKQLKKDLEKLIREYFVTCEPKDHLGRYTCPLTGKKFRASDMNVAHFIDRANYCLRYEEDNLVFCSQLSNFWDAGIQVEGYKSKHHRDFEKYLGPEKVAWLKERSQEICKLNKHKVQDYIDYYTLKLEQCQK